MPLLTSALKHLRDQGPRAFLRRVRQELRHRVLGTNIYCLYVKNLEGHVPLEGLPMAPGLEVHIVETTADLERLEAEGYTFDSPETARRLLELGAIGFYGFVDRDFAHVSWMATTEASKEPVDPIPYEVDFEGGEVCTGAVFTSPAHRRKGIHLVVRDTVFRYEHEQGFKRNRSTIRVDNVAPRTTLEKFGAEVHALIRRRRFLWWTFYRQGPPPGPGASVP